MYYLVVQLPKEFGKVREDARFTVGPFVTELARREWRKNFLRQAKDLRWPKSFMDFFERIENSNPEMKRIPIKVKDLNVLPGIRMYAPDDLIRGIGRLANKLQKKEATASLRAGGPIIYPDD